MFIPDLDFFSIPDPGDRNPNLAFLVITLQFEHHKSDEGENLRHSLFLKKPDKTRKIEI
jgi:hypothetical protein